MKYKQYITAYKEFLKKDLYDNVINIIYEYIGNIEEKDFELENKYILLSIFPMYKIFIRQNNFVYCKSCKNIYHDFKNIYIKHINSKNHSKTIIQYLNNKIKIDTKNDIINKIKKKSGKILGENIIQIILTIK